MARKSKKSETFKGTINDITNLKFYTSKGYEIPMQKSYVLTWELIPGKFASQYIKTQIKGYFIGDIEFSTDPNNKLKIKPNSLEAQFIDQGEVYVRFATQHTEDENGLPVFSYDETVTAQDYYAYLKFLFLDNENTVKVSINVKNTSYTFELDVDEIFDLSLDEDDPMLPFNEYFNVKTVYIGENIGENKEFYQTIGMSKVDLAPYITYEKQIDEEGNIVYEKVIHDFTNIQSIFEETAPNIGMYFPFVRYAGDFYQDRVSENFIAADTILVLEEVRLNDNTYKYTRPYITAESAYSMVFQPAANSELKIIDEASVYNILYKDEKAFSLANEPDANLTSRDVSEPFAFTIAFQASEEGAYQNLLGIYLRSNDQAPDEQQVFFMGAIAVKSVVEGEDERFRTLLTNFGVPDPVNYSNIFAEQDFAEQGKDYKLINKKSKELMLTYDQIFSYVGTYKALFRAIKFLGYQDIIFKEWYTIKDHNDKLTDIAVQVFDSSTGSFLKQKLADYGISIEDFNNYDKLNKLSMIYHFNEVSDETERIKVNLAQYNPETQTIDVSTTLPRTFLSGVPMTRPLYIYRNEETMAKLFAVKRWLEQHIIGVGAYIADITGEGIYFCWQKTQGYTTEHFFDDFSKAQYYTPDLKHVGKFIDSSAIVACTLNELNNAVRFVDYENTPINAFDKYDVSVNLKTDDGTYIDSSVLTISNSIEAPVLGDEYEFDLINKPTSGTLYEWTSHEDDAQILIQDGEIKLLYDHDTEAFISSDCLPIITLENANIHNAYGNWRTNIKWLIRETINGDTGNTQYELKNYRLFLDNSNVKIDNQYIVLKPDDSSGAHPYIKYSEKNKWDIPMFIIHGYKFDNVEFDRNHVIGYDNDSSQYITMDEHDYYNLEDPNSDFILEILKGDMLFKDVDNCACQISFSTDLIKNGREKKYTMEQEIQPTYTYHSERKAFVNLDSSSIQYEANNTTVECADEIININNNIINDTSIINRTSTKRINSFLTGLPSVAYEAALEYYDTSLSYIEDVSNFINEHANSTRKKLLDAQLTEIINDNYTFNRTINVSVSRLGQYDLVTRAFDKYNNMFTSKYDNKINVVAQPIPIDTIVENPNSNNSSSFYRFNTDGVLETSDASRHLLISHCDNEIEYPETYPIYEIDYNLEDDYVEFDNISYAIDTPKVNDTVIFTTLNERCVSSDISIDETGKYYLQLNMLDENPNKIFLYAENSSIQKQLSIFAYDAKRKNVITLSENLQIIDSSLVNQENDINYEADSYILVDFKHSVNDSLNGTKSHIIDLNNLINTNVEKYKVFVLNTTEYPIIPISKDASYYNVTFNKDKRLTVLRYDGDQVFNNEDVIKIRYYMNVSWPEEYTVERYMHLAGIDTSKHLDKETILNKKIINETAYRIIDVSKYVIESEDENTPDYVYYEYTLDGLLNTNLLDSSCIDTYMMYAAQRPVRYSTKIMSNAYEFNQIIGLGNYSIIRDHFNFNSTRLFLNDYIDDTYSIEVEDYDYVNGEKYWVDFKSKYIGKYADLDLYYYHQFPISVDQGTNVIFRSHNSNHTLREGFKQEWKVQVGSVDELSNLEYDIHSNNKHTLFRSINDYLTIKPYMLGSHNISLECTDIYGNRLINPGEGLLFVKDNGKYENYSYI